MLNEYIVHYLGTISVYPITDLLIIRILHVESSGTSLLLLLLFFFLLPVSSNRNTPRQQPYQYLAGRWVSRMRGCSTRQPSYLAGVMSESGGLKGEEGDHHLCCSPRILSCRQTQSIGAVLHAMLQRDSRPRFVNAVQSRWRLRRRISSVELFQA